MSWIEEFFRWNPIVFGVLVFMIFAGGVKLLSWAYWYVFKRKQQKQIERINQITARDLERMQQFLSQEEREYRAWERAHGVDRVRKKGLL